MNRNRSILTVLTAFLCITLGVGNMAQAQNLYLRVLPFPNINKVGFDQYQQFQMQKGYWEGELVWFICTDTNDLRTAFDSSSNNTLYWQGLTFAPKLTNAAGNVATMYLVLNYQQGPVFTDVPGGSTYSGLWQITYIKFKPDATKHAVTNTAPYDPDTNPTGLPDAADADYFTTNDKGQPVIIDCPIMAVGPLGGPWLPAPEGRYRIPQAKVFYDYSYTKMIWLPYWNVYCQDPVTKRVGVKQIIVPDVYDPLNLPDVDKLADKIGANLAPGLAAICIPERPQAAQSIPCIGGLPELFLCSMAQFQQSICAGIDF